jgi:hypothetical protein
LGAGTASNIVAPLRELGVIPSNPKRSPPNRAADRIGLDMINLALTDWVGHF